MAGRDVGQPVGQASGCRVHSSVRAINLIVGDQLMVYDIRGCLSPYAYALEGKPEKRLLLGIGQCQAFQTSEDEWI